MKPIRILVLAGLVAGVWLLTVFLLDRRPTEVRSQRVERPDASGGATRAEQTQPATQAAPGPVVAGAEQQLDAAVPVPPKEADGKAQPPKVRKPGSPSGNQQAKDPIQDPMARLALSFVGADPAAEAYWYEAINDLSLPPNERKDLIEDLNEDGISDPKHPGMEDLPLIVSRLALLEEVAADAADQVNADAFAEAYKDLVNMYAALTRGR